MSGDLTMLWVALALLTAGVFLILLPNLMQRRDAIKRRDSFDLAVYRDQLAEVDRDLERGVIRETEAAAARREIQQRISAAARSAGIDDEGASRSLRTSAAIGIALFVPAAGLILYLYLGNPNLPDMPLSERQADIAALRDPAAFAELVQRLEKRLEEQPEDVTGWTMLGRSYRVMGRQEDAAMAFDRALAVSGENVTAPLLADYGESLVLLSAGRVTPQAGSAFERALALDPANPKARFYTGIAREQAGDTRQAIAIWRGLEDAAGDDAPWLRAVQDRIAEASAALGVDPSTIPPAQPEASPAAPARGPSAEDVAAARNMAPEERTAFIRSMVDGLAARLAENPDDPQGWLRLGRSYLVLGERAKASDALDRSVAGYEARLAGMPADAAGRAELQQGLAAARDLIARLPKE